MGPKLASPWWGHDCARAVTPDPRARMLISATLCRILMSVSLSLLRDLDDHGGPLRAALAGVVDRAVGGRCVEREAVRAVARDGRGDVEVHGLPLRHAAERAERRPIYRRPRVPGDGALVPAASRDRVQRAARDALRIGHLRDLQLQVRRRDPARADAGDAHPEEDTLYACATGRRRRAVVRGEQRLRAEVRARLVRLDVG